MHQFINEFKVADRIEGFYLIKQLNIKTSSNNKKYLDLVLGDSSGEVDSKIWGITDEEALTYKQGDVIKIRADVTSWQGKTQLKIIMHRTVEPTDEVDYDSIVPTSPINAMEMYNFLRDRADKIQNEDVKKMAFAALELHGSKIMYYPAAMRNHHAVRSGLLYHVYRMTKAGDMLSELYKADADLLFTGIIYHDIEKIEEILSNELGIVSSYSKKGNLLGHISMGVVSIDRIGRELGVDEELILLLQHMVLSHHYEAEYGSPKKPMFKEAQLLHMVDIMDARMYDIDKAINDTKAGDFSQPIFSLDRVKVYKSPFLYKEEE